MATFNPASLSALDQAAYSRWQQQMAAFLRQNGGISAGVSYAQAHPEYLQSHPELQQEYNLVTGASLPPAVKSALQGYHVATSGTPANLTADFQKNRGLWGNWETYLQLGLGAGLGGVAAAGLMGAAAPSAAPSAAGGGVGAGTGAGTASTLTGIGATNPAAYVGTDVLSTAAAASPAGLAPTSVVPALGTLPAGAPSAAGTAALNAAYAAPGVTSGPLTNTASNPGVLGQHLNPTAAEALRYGLPAAGTILGNIAQNRGVQNAVNDQVTAQQAGQAAMDRAVSSAVGRYSPWAGVGAAAMNKLGDLMHLTPGGSTPGQVPVTPTQQSSANTFMGNAVQNSPDAATRALYNAGGPQPGPYANWPIIEMPDGSRRRVSPDQLQNAIAGGGRVVSQQLSTSGAPPAPSTAPVGI